MALGDSEVRQRRNRVSEHDARAAPTGRNDTVANQQDSDLAFFAFCSVVMNAAAALVTTFSYGIYIPGPQDEVTVLGRAAVLSVLVAALAGTISWHKPVVGSAFLCGMFFGVMSIFGGMLVLGEDTDPMQSFLYGWLGASTVLYIIFKTQLWTPY